MDLTNPSEWTVLVSESHIARCNREAKNKDKISDLIDDETPVQHKNEEQSSPTPDLLQESGKQRNTL